MSRLRAGALVAICASLCIPGCGGSLAPTDQTNPGGAAAGGTTAAGSGGSSAFGGGPGGKGGGTAGAGPCSTDPSDPDADRDGYDKGEDCDDSQNAVNPGAFDVPGNGVDDDCDGGIDNGAGIACDDAGDVIPMDTNDPVAMARSMGLCGKNPARTPIFSWGVWSVELAGLRTPWTAKRSDLQHGVHTEFGSQFKPKQGRSMLMLSTGIARTKDQPGGTESYPALSAFPLMMSSTAEILPNGFPENDPVCLANTSIDDRTAWNPIALRMNLRTPTNAVQLAWSARAITPTDLDEEVCRGNNHIFAAFKEKYEGSSAAINVARLPDGSPFSVDHIAFTLCGPQSFERGDRVYTYTCPAGQISGSRPWSAAASDWNEFVVDVAPGADLELTFITWAHGEIEGDAFGVFLDDFHWISSTTSSPACSP